MLTFNHIGTATEAEIQRTENYFTNNLGHCLEEFEQKATIITVDHNQPSESTNFFQYGFKGAYNIGEFIGRFNEWKRVEKV